LQKETQLKPELGTDTYANATNNAQVELLVKFAAPETVDNFDGTYGYIINSADYATGNVSALVSEYTEEGRLVSAEAYKDFSGRKQIRIAQDAEKQLMVWDGLVTMKPLVEKVKIEK
jgi:hypothetical protein